MLVALLAVTVTSGSAATCACPDSIGAEAGASPLIVLAKPTERQGLIACGYLESRDGSTVRASEFEVFPCGSDKPVVTFGALQTAILRASGEELLITEITRWPFGQDWQWVDVPIWEYALAPGQPPHVTKALVLEAPRLSIDRVRDALTQYEAARAKRQLPEDPEELVGRLLAAALAGSREAQAALAGMRSTLNLDGAGGEAWQAAVDVYQLYARTTGKVPRLPGV